MATERVIEAADGRAPLPMWVQCIVAVVGVAALVGPAVAVVWYR